MWIGKWGQRSNQLKLLITVNGSYQVKALKGGLNSNCLIYLYQLEFCGCQRLQNWTNQGSYCRCSFSSTLPLCLLRVYVTSEGLLNRDGTRIFHSGSLYPHAWSNWGPKHFGWVPKSWRPCLPPPKKLLVLLLWERVTGKLLSYCSVLSFIIKIQCILK